MPELSVNVHNLLLKNPVMSASGTFGYGPEFDDFIDVNRIGGILTKACLECLILLACKIKV